MFIALADHSFYAKSLKRTPFPHMAAHIDGSTASYGPSCTDSANDQPTKYTCLHANGNSLTLLSGSSPINFPQKNCG